MKPDPRIWPRSANGKLAAGVAELLVGAFVLITYLTGSNDTFGGLLRVMSFAGSVVLIVFGVYYIAHGVVQRRRPADYAR